MTIRFEDLCKRLKDNTEEKNVYFNHLEAENFLLPFDRKGMLNFDDAAGGAVISYLQKLLAKNVNLKNTIIDVINKNLDIEPLNLSYYNYMALADFIFSFDLSTALSCNASPILYSNSTAIPSIYSPINNAPIVAILISKFSSNISFLNKCLIAFLNISKPIST